MADLMIDLETLGTGPDACILTIAAQSFDPLGQGWFDKQYYARVDTDTQPSRIIEEGTVQWWMQQSSEAQAEAFGEDNRIPLEQALDELGKLIWHSKRVWANGPTFDCTILEHAYKSFKKPLPWKYSVVRDARTIYSLYPDLPKPIVTHHALEDCRRQIKMLQETLTHLRIKNIR